MNNLSSLHALLSHLQGYGEGNQLKRQAMAEVESALHDLGLSRRAFLREARTLGYDITTITSLGNWISCRYMPSTANGTA